MSQLFSPMRRSLLGGLGAVLAYRALPGELSQPSGWGPSAAMASHSAIEGFGANATGGTNPYLVTNLNDSGPGSLRAGLVGGNRITFHPSLAGGTLSPGGHLTMNGANGQNHITIDATSIGGLTINSSAAAGLNPTHGAHDIIIRGFRVQNGDDCIGVFRECSNIVIDHCSTRFPQDGGIDITEGSFNVTVQWCILTTGIPIPQGAGGNMLIKYSGPSGGRIRRISVHHCLFVESQERRNPQIRIDDGGGVAPAGECTADVRCCVMYNTDGVRFWHGARGNLINCFIKPNSGAVLVESTNGFLFASGNKTTTGNPNAGTLASMVPVDSYAQVTTEEACTAAELVLAHAGSRPLDSFDQSLVATVNLALCPGTGGLSPTAPSGLTIG